MAKLSEGWKLEEIEMTRTEALNISKSITQTFPGKIRDYERKNAVSRLPKFEVAAAVSALAAEKSTGVMDWERFWEACGRVDVILKSSSSELSFAETMRRQNPCLSRYGDFATIVIVHRDWWFKHSVRASEASEAELGRSVSVKDKPVSLTREIQGRVGSVGCASQCRTGCLNALISAGMNIPMAEEWAETIFLDPANFKTCLTDLKSAQSTRETAVACPV